MEHMLVQDPWRMTDRRGLTEPGMSVRSKAEGALPLSVEVRL